MNAVLGRLARFWQSQEHLLSNCQQGGVVKDACSNNRQRQDHSPPSARSPGGADASQPDHRVAFRQLAGIVARARGQRNPAGRNRRFEFIALAQRRSFLRLKAKPRDDARGFVYSCCFRPWPGGFRCWPIRRPERRTPRLPGSAPAPPSAGAPACPRSSAAPACERPRRAGSCHGH